MLRELVVPEAELLDRVVPGHRPACERLEQAIPLLRHLLICGKLGNIPPVDLTDEQIHETAAALRRAVDKLEILRREEDGLERPDRIEHAARLLVDPYDLAERSAGLVGPLQAKLDGDLAVYCVDDTNHAAERRDPELSPALPVDDIAIMLAARRAQGREHAGGFE